MKIAYLTAGAAGMFCGSCLNDNALAKQLIRLGHDCLLVPVYTPIRTDDDDVSIDRVFMGGINVYLQQKLPWLAYTPRWIDHILNQPWLIAPLTKNAGKTSPKLLGAMAVSMLKGTAGRQRKEFLRMLDWLDRDIQPDAIVLTNLLIGGCIPDIQRRSRAKVFVTLQGDDIFLDSLPAPFRDQAIEKMRELAPKVDGFIVHSSFYGQTMSRLLDLPVERFHVVPLAIPTVDFQIDDRKETSPVSSSAVSTSAVSTSTGGVASNSQPVPFTIGYLARMAPEKGLDPIVDAFIEIASAPGFEHVRLKMAGWMGPQHQDLWSEQQRKLKEAGLDGRWEYCGSVDREGKRQFLRSLDLFCVPTRYAEPKGLFLLEAVASGVPYLQPAHGAFPELHQRLIATTPSLHIGKLYDPKSPRELINALREEIARRTTRYQVPEVLLREIDIAEHANRIVSLLESKSSLAEVV